MAISRNSMVPVRPWSAVRLMTLYTLVPLPWVIVPRAVVKLSPLKNKPTVPGPVPDARVPMESEVRFTASPDATVKPKEK